MTKLTDNLRNFFSLVGVSVTLIMALQSFGPDPAGVVNDDKVIDIVHIDNVDEMGDTPVELYFFTDNGKYFFNGQTTILVSEYDYTDR